MKGGGNTMGKTGETHPQGKKGKDPPGHGKKIPSLPNSTSQQKKEEDNSECTDKKPPPESFFKGRERSGEEFSDFLKKQEKQKEKTELFGLFRGFFLFIEKSGEAGFFSVGLVFVDGSGLDGLVKGGTLLVEEGNGQIFVTAFCGGTEFFLGCAESVSAGFVTDAGLFAVALRLDSGFPDFGFGH